MVVCSICLRKAPLRTFFGFLFKVLLNEDMFDASVKVRPATKALVLVFLPGDTVVVLLWWYQAGPRSYRLLSHGDSTVDQKEDWRARSRDKTISTREKITTQGPPTTSRSVTTSTLLTTTLAPIYNSWTQSVASEAPRSLHSMPSFQQSTTTPPATTKKPPATA